MSKLDEATRGRYLNRLFKDNLGRHLDWVRPVLQNHIGPYQPSAFNKYENTRKHIFDACTEMLRRLSDEEISILADHRMDDPEEIRSEWHSFQQDEIYRLNKTEPPWYAGGFGHPDHIADFEYWAQVRHLSKHEALFLSLGVEPDHISPDEVKEMATSLGKGGDLWEALKYMLRRREQIERQFPDYVCHGEIEPEQLFDWFELVNLTVHPAFTSRYLANNVPASSTDDPTDETRPHKREIDSVCQLFTAMAIEYYGYEPDAIRSPIAKEIGELAASLGVEISDDTIRKYLKRGARFISPEWKPK